VEKKGLYYSRLMGGEEEIKDRGCKLQEGRGSGLPKTSIGMQGQPVVVKKMNQRGKGGFSNQVKGEKILGEQGSVSNGKGGRLRLGDKKRIALLKVAANSGGAQTKKGRDQCIKKGQETEAGHLLIFRVFIKGDQRGKSWSSHS